MTSGNVTLDPKMKTITKKSPLACRQRFEGAGALVSCSSKALAHGSPSASSDARRAGLDGSAMGVADPFLPIRPGRQRDGNVTLHPSVLKEIAAVGFSIGPKGQRDVASHHGLVRVTVLAVDDVPVSVPFAPGRLEHALWFARHQSMKGCAYVRVPGEMKLRVFRASASVTLDPKL